MSHRQTLDTAGARVPVTLLGALLLTMSAACSADDLVDENFDPGKEDGVASVTFRLHEHNKWANLGFECREWFNCDVKIEASLSTLGFSDQLKPAVERLLAQSPEADHVRVPAMRVTISEIAWMPKHPPYFDEFVVDMCGYRDGERGNAALVPCDDVLDPIELARFRVKDPRASFEVLLEIEDEFLSLAPGGGLLGRIRAWFW